MNSLYLYFFKQYKNIWQNLSFRIRIEIIILFIVYFTFFTTRLIEIFKEQLINSNTTSLGLSQFVLHLLLFAVSISIPFIHLNLIPKQTGFVNFRTLPLNNFNTFWLLVFLHLKYQIIGFIIILPLFFTLLVTCGILISLYFLSSIILYEVVLILLISEFSTNSIVKTKIYIRYFFIIIIALFIYFILYFYTDYYFLFDLVLIAGSFLYLILNWQNNWINWDSFIINKSNSSKDGVQKSRLISYSSIQKYPFLKITPFIAKELLNYFRNKKFIRMQLIAFVLYSLILLILHFKSQENFILLSFWINTAIYLATFFSAIQ